MVALVLPVLSLLVVILLVAFFIETLVEFVFSDLFLKIPGAEKFHWTVKYVAIGVAIYAAFHYQFDLIALLANLLEINMIQVSVFGIIVTGVAIGKGSNYLHDVFKRFFLKPVDEILEGDTE